MIESILESNRCMTLYFARHTAFRCLLGFTGIISNFYCTVASLVVCAFTLHIAKAYFQNTNPQMYKAFKIFTFMTPGITASVLFSSLTMLSVDCVFDPAYSLITSVGLAVPFITFSIGAMYALYDYICERREHRNVILTEIINPEIQI